MKHYIRIENTNIIKGFSDAFEQPLETDICVNENGGRHYNPSLFDEDMCPKLKYVENIRVIKEEQIVINEVIVEEETVIEDGVEVIIPASTVEEEVIIPAETEIYYTIEDLTDLEKADWRLVNIIPEVNVDLNSEVIQAILKANTIEELKNEIISNIYVV